VRRVDGRDHPQRSHRGVEDDQSPFALCWVEERGEATVLLLRGALAALCFRGATGDARWAVGLVWWHWARGGTSLTRCPECPHRVSQAVLTRGGCRAAALSVWA
jgi:hypothetical protein